MFLILVKLLSGFPGGSEGTASACSAGDLGLIPGLGRSPGEGNGTPLQYSCLENPKNRGAWWATVHGVAKSWTWLSDEAQNTAHTQFLPLTSQTAQWSKNMPANAGDRGDTNSIPGSGRTPGEGNGNPLQCSCLGNPMDRGTWWATDHAVAKNSIQLSSWAQQHNFDL